MTGMALDTPAVSTRFANDDDRWSAVARRDPAADGVFFYSVRSTGVYCRPSCAARLPRRGNVSFHRSTSDAERAGFRPCKRCRPNDAPLAARRAAAVARACRLIEESETMPTLDALAASVGMSRFHFHRVFKAVTGVTPQEYAAAHRASRVRRELRESPTVTDAIYGAGFNSNGRFYATAAKVLGMTPTDYRAGGSGASIRFAIGECSLGSILVAASDKGVCAILLGDNPDALARDLQDRFPNATLTAGDGEFDAWVGKGGRIRRNASARPRPSARRARHGVPAARLACAVGYSGWIHSQLLGNRPRRSARRARCARSPRHAAPMLLRWRFLATG